MQPGTSAHAAKNELSPEEKATDEDVGRKRVGGEILDRRPNWGPNLEIVVNVEPYTGQP